LALVLSQREGKDQEILEGKLDFPPHVDTPPTAALSSARFPAKSCCLAGDLGRQVCAKSVQQEAIAIAAAESGVEVSTSFNIRGAKCRAGNAA
jgi:hypothetical protein